MSSAAHRPVGWITPFTNQAYREAAFEHQFPRAPFPPGHGFWPPRGPAELTAGELADALRVDAINPTLLWRQAHNRLALIALVPASLLLGVQIHRLLRRRGWQRNIAATAMLIGFGPWFVVTTGARILSGVLAIPQWPPFRSQLPLVVHWPVLGDWLGAVWTAQAWLIPVVFLAMAVALARLDSRPARM